MFFPYKTTPVLASMTIPASESMEMSAGQSVEASACIGAASRDSKSVPIKNKDNLLPVLPAIFVFKSGAAGWLELPGELPPPEFPEFSLPYPFPGPYDAPPLSPLSVATSQIRYQISKS